MYNRYIPQSDGSFQKKQMQDNAPKEPANRKPTPPPVPPSCHTPEKCPPCKKPSPTCKQEGITDFFKQLLPRDLDTADLLIIILLLLMASDSEESRNNALLTLALYFFL